MFYRDKCRQMGSVVIWEKYKKMKKKKEKHKKKKFKGNPTLLRAE